jgi:hypothetical protein
MSYGLQVYNSLGQIRLNSDDRIPRYLGIVTSATSTGYPIGPVFGDLNTFIVDVPFPGVFANSDYFLLLTHKIAQTEWYDYHGKAFYSTRFDGTVSGLITSYTVCVIRSLPGTTQSQWNTLAGTTGVTYSVGDWFFNEKLGTGLGTGGVSIYLGDTTVSYSAGYAVPTHTNINNRYPAYAYAYDGGFKIKWGAKTATKFASGALAYQQNKKLFYILQVYKY